MLDYFYGISSQWKSCNKSPQIMPKVKNANNIYQFEKTEMVLSVLLQNLLE